MSKCFCIRQMTAQIAPTNSNSSGQQGLNARGKVVPMGVQGGPLLNESEPNSHFKTLNTFWSSEK